MSNEIPERVAIVEQIAASAHKRIDTHADEIKGLRGSRHEHSNMLQRHQGVISQHSEILTRLEVTVAKVTDAAVSIKAIATTAIFMGAGFVGFCVFVAGEILKWW